MTPEDRPAKTPFSDLKKQALEHYEELANIAHHWNSFVPKAIEAYNPEAIEQYLKWLDEEFNSWSEHWNSAEYIAGAKYAFEKAKEKFLSLTQPQSINNDKTGDTR